MSQWGHMIHSHAIEYSDFDSDWYKKWAIELKQDKNYLDGHKIKANKFWQNAVMVQSLYERGLLKSGNKCVGFGVGQERLPALFAKQGLKITATDQNYRTKEAQHWEEHELATGLKSLNKLGICKIDIFKRNVTYQSADMKKIPHELFGQYDFLWSNCALGHLGSINEGLNFIVNSTRCLKPNGYAVHTTEVNVLSNSETLDNNPQTVIFRLKDIYRLGKMLETKGFKLDPLRFNLGTTKRDGEISMSPEFGNDFTKLQVGGYLSTQIILIISPLKKSLRLSSLQKIIEKRNLINQKRFDKTNPLIKEVRNAERVRLDKGMLTPVSKNIKVTLKGKPGYIYLEYSNESNMPLFGFNYRLRSTKPLALATAEPVDRSSPFKADDWFNNQANRPSIYLYKKTTHGRWESLDYVRPHSKFAFRVKLDPSRVKKGNYNEVYSLVQEGSSHIEATSVEVNIKVS